MLVGIETLSCVGVNIMGTPREEMKERLPAKGWRAIISAIYSINGGAFATDGVVRGATVSCFVPSARLLACFTC